MSTGGEILNTWLCLIVIYTQSSNLSPILSFAPICILPIITEVKKIILQIQTCFHQTSRFKSEFKKKKSITPDFSP